MNTSSICAVMTSILIVLIMTIVVILSIKTWRSWDRIGQQLNLRGEHDAYSGIYRSRKLYIKKNIVSRSRPRKKSRYEFEAILTIEVVMNCETNWKFDLRPNLPNNPRLKYLREKLHDEEWFPPDNVFGPSIRVQSAWPPTIIRKIFENPDLRQQMIEQTDHLRLMFLKGSHLRYDANFYHPDLVIPLCDLLNDIADVIERQHQTESSLSME